MSFLATVLASTLGCLAAIFLLGLIGKVPDWIGYWRFLAAEKRRKAGR